MKIINQDELKKFIAAAMSKHVHIENNLKQISNDFLNDIEMELISIIIQRSEEYQSKLIKHRNMKVYLEKADRGERIYG